MTLAQWTGEISFGTKGYLRGGVFECATYGPSARWPEMPGAEDKYIPGELGAGGQQRSLGSSSGGAKLRSIPRTNEPL